MKRSVPFVLSGVYVLITAMVAVSISRSLAQSSENRSLSATFAHGVLHVSIPYSAPRSGEGSLLVEVLDPEDRPAASITRHADVNAGQGFWNRKLVLPKNLPFDELVWHRLRYRFTYAEEKAAPIEGVTSISRILRLPVVHILGQQSYLSGGAAAVRLIVNEADNETPITSGSVQIELVQPGHKNQVLFTGTLNEHGTTPVQFHFPAGLVGRYSLRYAVDTSLGPVEHVEEIRLEDKSSILLTTEKPIYQPGQTIHVRALALDRANHQAVAGRELTFELDDSRGNKVFRKITQTDEYGLASAEFGLADEVNLGTYHLRAILGNTQGPTSSEIALQVDRYVLPRFKVAVEIAGKDNKTKRGYRPGDHVTGTVRANYFFGKPVDGEVTVKASGFDVARFDAGNSSGRTDREGTFQFDIRLPDFFAGHPLNQGAARLLMEATVKDTSGHSESRGEPVTVSESPLLITVVPESGSLIPGLENRVYVLTSYPDGTPAQSDVRVETSGTTVQTAATDGGGIAIVSLPGWSSNVRVKAKDREGNHASVRVEFETRAAGSDQVLLRAERAVYRAGEPIRLEVLTTKQSGCVYVDAVKDGQTIGTHDLNIAKGRATLELAATPDMTGTVEFHAYLFGSNASPIGDRRLVFVQPANELRIATSLDAPVYRPGSEARIGFRVTNNRGEGVQAALGVEIIDQAVFALAEKQPGFAKVFFYLEQEALKPRYEIHSVTLADAITLAEPAESNRRDRAAQALFAAARTVAPNSAPVEFGGTVPQDKYREFSSRYLARLRDQMDQIAGVESGGNSQTCDNTLLASGLRKANFRDAWGNHLSVSGNLPGTKSFEVRSAGPDGQFYTPDDLIQFRDERYCIVPAFQATGGTFDVRIVPNGAETEIVGTVADSTGAVIPHAEIRLFEKATGKVHSLSSNAGGRFELSRLAAGHFEIRISVPGFRTAARELSLAKGDRAVLFVVLNVAAMTETVEVMAAAPALNTMSAEISLAKVSRRPKDASPATSPGTTPEAHVRAWFPEALYVTPKIITDNHGRASITIPIADNITTWRMAMMASTKQGALGSGTSSLKVFQDFFTELDLPVTLTQGDRVSIPVAVYNYSGTRGQVRLQLAPGDWFSLAGDTDEKSLAVENDRVGGSQFTIEAKRIGKFKLTLKAELEGSVKRADIVIRDIEVVPNGRQQTVAFNGRVETSAEHTVAFPPNAIPDAGKIFVRLYPGPLSQVVEGMDAILRMPYGCFEQTSSATYPNVLALDYMKRTKKLTPEVHAKAEGFIANGYQRLLTFEVTGGGFSWFGQAPANKILTSYGLMEFADMAKVYDVDARVIQRTQQWLARQQQPDGSWKPDTSFINEGATNRYNTDVLRITAYIAWALQNSGYQGPEIERARQFISRNLSGTLDAYTLAILANFATDFQDRALTRQAVEQLVDARTEKDDQAFWTSEETSVYGRGASAAVETTGLVLQALLKSGEAPSVTRKALNFIGASKDASGTWGTTQATIMALRALLLSMEKGSAEARGAVDITLNGKPAGRLTLTRENGDIFHQFVFKNIDFSGSNKVGIDFKGEGSPAYQVAGEYFVPWTAKTSDEPLSIEVSYDRTRLSQGDLASATATVKNRLSKTANMVMVELGIPPGFELLSEDFDDYRNKSAGRKSGRLEKFNLSATQATLYFASIGAGETVVLHYRLRAKYPIRTRTFQSRVYQYYEPEVKSVARPVEMEIRKR
ncbi:MAG TPA: MG2 domain-containing protein [Bryobacteraceae bacterium]|nr:MG2 domain-containing protein [Bryobacteraceae bacterium]